MTYQAALQRDPFALAALSIPGLHGPRLHDAAFGLLIICLAKGRLLHPDHLRQLARRLVK